MLEYELALQQHRGPVKLSEDFAVWAALRSAGDDLDGHSLAQALTALQTHGICDEALVPQRSVSLPYGLRPFAGSGR